MHDQEEASKECISMVYIDIDEEDGCYSEAEKSMMRLASRYHPLYLQSTPMEFMFPIRFEEGMGYKECEKYYSSLQGTVGKNLRQANARSPRRSTKAEIQQQAKGTLRSCLRTSRRGVKDFVERTRMIRRISSFSDGSPPVTSPEQLRELKPWTSLRNMAEGPSVAFEPLIHVITIFPYYEYPDEVWSSIWNTPNEMHRMVRQATREQRKERIAAKRGIEVPGDELNLIYGKDQVHDESMFEIETNTTAVRKGRCPEDGEVKYDVQDGSRKLHEPRSSDWMSDSDTVCSDFSNQ